VAVGASTHRSHHADKAAVALGFGRWGVLGSG
jgi:hypothetical protein